MSDNVCFVDTETTGLDPNRHQIWEVGLIDAEGREHVWQFPIVELEADPFALDIGHYWDRRWSTQNDVDPIDALYEAHTPKARRQYFPEEGRAIPPSAGWCQHFRSLTVGAHLCGAVPSFDEERLRRLLRANGVLPRWHYHLIDVEALAAGYVSARCEGMAADGTKGTIRVERPDGTVNNIDGRPPWKSDDLSRAVGVNPDDFDRHTALGDARWAKAIYEAVMAP